MHYIIYPQKDCTIYSKHPDVNTGLDEMLEISKEVSSSIYFYRGVWDVNSSYRRFDYIVSHSISGSVSESKYYYAIAENIGDDPNTTNAWKSFTLSSANTNSRILIQFDLNQIPSEIQTSASVVYLNLFSCISKKIPIEYELEVYPVSKFWAMGTGNYTEKNSFSDGATWYRNTQTSSWDDDGGDYDMSPFSTQKYNFNSSDVRIDITDIFEGWRNDTIDNFGLIVKRPDLHEENTHDYGSLSFYSMDTHTVYVPTLEILYDDQLYDTSSFITSSFMSQSSYLSASVSESFIVVNSVEVSSSLIYYLSGSVSESDIDVFAPSTYVSGTIIYTTESINIDTALYNSLNVPYSVSSSIFYYISSSISESDIDILVDDNIPSSSIIYTTESVQFDELIYTTQSFITEDIEYIPVTSSILVHVPAPVTASLISGSIDITFRNFNPVYKFNTTPRFRLNVKEKYQAKTFYEELRIGEIKYLSDDLRYSLIDAYSNRIIIPYSDYTKISLDSEGHYFDVSLIGTMPERFYKILIKYTENGIDHYFDKNNIFKVTK